MNRNTKTDQIWLKFVVHFSWKMNKLWTFHIVKWQNKQTNIENRKQKLKDKHKNEKLPDDGAFNWHRLEHLDTGESECLMCSSDSFRERLIANDYTDIDPKMRCSVKIFLPYFVIVIWKVVKKNWIMSKSVCEKGTNYTFVFFSFNNSSRTKPTTRIHSERILYTAMRYLALYVLS